jgi:hypothetical protein
LPEASLICIAKGDWGLGMREITQTRRMTKDK